MTHALGVTLRASLPLSSLSSEVIHQSSSPVVIITMNWYWAVNLAGPCCIQCNISIKLINLENLTSVFTRMSLGGSFNFDFHPWSSLQTNNVHESKGSTIGSISIFSPQTFYISEEDLSNQNITDAEIMQSSYTLQLPRIAMKRPWWSLGTCKQWWW